MSELPEGWQRRNPLEEKVFVGPGRIVDSTEDDPVNPAHYRRGPLLHIANNPNTTGIDGEGREFTRCPIEFGERIFVPVEAIDIMRCIDDPRLATAFRYLWRVAFGGKEFLEEGQTQEAKNVQDIKKTIWYLSDWINNQPKVM